MHMSADRHSQERSKLFALSACLLLATAYGAGRAAPGVTPL